MMFPFLLPWRECGGPIKAKLETTVGNSKPRVRLALAGDDDAELTHRDDVVVDAHPYDVDEDEVELAFTWRPANEEFDPEKTYRYAEATLPASATRRGQDWVVRAVPTDGIDEGDPKEMTVSIP